MIEIDLLELFMFLIIVLIGCWNVKLY